MDKTTFFILFITIAIIIFSFLISIVKSVTKKIENEKKENVIKEQFEKKQNEQKRRFDLMLKHKEELQKIRIIRLKLDILKHEQLTKKRELQIKKLEEELEELEKNKIVKN